MSSTPEREQPTEAESHEQEPQRSGEEQRQRAGAAAAYAAAQHAAPRPETGADSDPEDAQQDIDEATASQQPAASEHSDAGEAARDGADGAAALEHEDDGGRQVQQDLHELTVKAEKADEYLALAQRTQADFENFRKRAAREASVAQERGVAKLAKELLPAIDNLERALKAMGEEHSQYAEGIKLVHTDLLSALQRVGVEPFSPDGEVFDPQLHEAVAQQPIDGAETGTVAEVFQQGFRLGDSVLRPARVLVAG